MSDVKVLDFGEVWSQRNFAWKIPLRNASSDSLSIVKFMTSCSCTSIVPDSAVVPEGETAWLTAYLDLTPSAGRYPWEWDGEFKVQVVGIPADPGRGSLRWDVVGRVRHPLRATPEMVDFGPNVIRGSEYTPSFVRLTLHPECQLKHVACEPSQASVILHRSGLYSRECTVEIIPNKSLLTGRHEFALEIHCTTRGGTSLPIVSLPVVCHVQHDVEVVPRQLALGRLVTRRPLVQFVILRSKTGKQFVVKEILSGNPGINVRAVRDDGSRSELTFEVSCDSIKQGLQRERVEFLVSQVHESNPYTVEYLILYDGL